MDERHISYVTKFPKKKHWSYGIKWALIPQFEALENIPYIWPFGSHINVNFKNSASFKLTLTMYFYFA